VGYYNDGHLARLRLINELQQRGFSLSDIAELIRAWEQGRSVSDLLRLEEAVTTPWSDETPEPITTGRLVEMFPDTPGDGGLAKRAVDLGILELGDDGFRVLSPKLLKVGAELVAAGVSTPRALEELAALREITQVMARQFVALIRQVGESYGDSFTLEQLTQFTRLLERIRPLALGAVDAILAQAMEREVAAATVEWLSKTTGARPEAEVGAF
jgi:DNA-binding transcriptional MerR regulator